MEFAMIASRQEVYTNFFFGNSPCGRVQRIKKNNFFEPLKGSASVRVQS